MNTRPLPLSPPDVQAPIRHSASCASLSLALLHFLNTTLPAPPSLTLSVGSGPGLLEALLLQHFPSRAALTLTNSTVTTTTTTATTITTTNNVNDNDHDHDADSPPLPPTATASFYGVEVKNVNRFLPDANALTVPGTWAVAEAAAGRAEALLFVYPRQPALLQAYLDKGDHVQTAVWIGPRCDEEDFMKPLRGWGVEDAGAISEVANGSGRLVEEGEVVAVFRRRKV